MFNLCHSTLQPPPTFALALSFASLIYTHTPTSTPAPSPPALDVLRW